jgi:hypothetical protein
LIGHAAIRPCAYVPRTKSLSLGILCGSAMRDAACARKRAAADVSEIHVEIFELDRPIAVDRSFDAGTDGPAGVCRSPAKRD